MIAANSAAADLWLGGAGFVAARAGGKAVLVLLNAGAVSVGVRLAVDVVGVVVRAGIVATWLVEPQATSPVAVSKVTTVAAQAGRRVTAAKSL